MTVSPCSKATRCRVDTVDTVCDLLWVQLGEAGDAGVEMTGEVPERGQHQRVSLLHLATRGWSGSIESSSGWDNVDCAGAAIIGIVIRLRSDQVSIRNSDQIIYTKNICLIYNIIFV